MILKGFHPEGNFYEIIMDQKYYYPTFTVDCVQKDF